MSDCCSLLASASRWRLLNRYHRSFGLHYQHFATAGVRLRWLRCQHHRAVLLTPCHAIRWHVINAFSCLAQSHSGLNRFKSGWVMFVVLRFTCLLSANSRTVLAEWLWAFLTKSVPHHKYYQSVLRNLKVDKMPLTNKRTNKSPILSWCDARECKEIRKLNSAHIYNLYLFITCNSF